MAVKISAGREVAAYEAIDTRLVLTKEEMRNIIGDDDPGTTPGDHAMPEKYFALCTDDNCMYVFDYEATPNDETGKFVKMVGGTASGAIASPAQSGNSDDMSFALDTASKGDLFYNTDDGKLYFADGDPLEWIEKGPSKGEMIFDETPKKIKYYDGSRWKDIVMSSNVNSSPLPPSNPAIGERWLDTDADPTTLKEWDGSAWVPVSPELGEIIYDIANDKLMYFNGSNWNNIIMPPAPSVQPDNVTIRFNENNKLETVRKIYVLDEVPDPSFGNVGDIAFVKLV